VGLTGLGLLAGLAVTWDDPPSILAPLPASGSAAVTTRLFDDAQTVTMSLDSGPPQAWRSPANGRLTRLSCRVGGTVASGQSVASIDGLPVLDLATAVPLWRDLELGDSGPDVTAVGEELVRLGRLDAPAPETVTGPLLRAYQSAARDVGLSASQAGTSSIPRERIAWLPAASSPVAACPIAVGVPLALDQPVITFQPNIVAATVVSPATTLVPGPRTVTVGAVTVNVPENGVVTDPTDLSALAATGQIRQSSDDASQASLSGRYRLAQPIEVGVIPPAALATDQAGRHCVSSGNQTVAVTVVGSELGQTLVTFAADPPREVSLRPPSDLTCG